MFRCPPQNCTMPQHFSLPFREPERNDFTRPWERGSVLIVVAKYQLIGTALCKYRVSHLLVELDLDLGVGWAKQAVASTQTLTDIWPVYLEGPSLSSLVPLSCQAAQPYSHQPKQNWTDTQNSSQPNPVHEQMGYPVALHLTWFEGDF